MTKSQEDSIALSVDDGHHWTMPLRRPQQPKAALLWLPAMGVPARHYLPFADMLAQRGVAVFVHEWRGLGSSSLRAGRHSDWGYREVLELDLDVAARAARAHLPAQRWIVGGHSLGGQMACCHAGLSGLDYAAFWLVATGTPYWRTFSAPQRYLLPALYRFLPWLARRNGTLPGRRLGFAGNEARSLIGDWARVGLSNRYRAEGLSVDLDQAMAGLQGSARGVRFRDDWLVTQASLDGLAAKMPQTRFHTATLEPAHLGTRADHFAWMKQPQAVVDALLIDDRHPAPAVPEAETGSSPGA